MKNGEYELVVAPAEFPGKKYRGRYCYEHTLVYWQNTGKVPGPNECIHHENHKKRDNRFENLELKLKVKHSSEHSRARGRKWVLLKCPSCRRKFDRVHSQTHLAKGGIATDCSQACSRRENRGMPFDGNVIRVFRKVSGLGS